MRAILVPAWGRPPRALAARGGALLAAAAMVGAVAAPAATAKTRIYRAVADATISAKRPGWNSGRSERLHVRRGVRAYLKFQVTLPADERVVSSRLRLRPQRAVTIRRASNDWRERRITWRTRPRAGRALTRLDRTGTVTYVLTSDASRDLQFLSRESGHAPALVLTTTRVDATATQPPAGDGQQPPAAPPVPPGPPSDPIGPRVPLGDLPGWKQIFVDDFTREVPLGQFPRAVSWKWWAYPNDWHDTSGMGIYDPKQTLSAHGGILNSFIHTKAGVHLVSAPVLRLPGTSGGVSSTPSGRLYGRYSVRFRADPIPGYKTAWLLWPDSKQWPRDGEIDFPEGDLDGPIHWFVHHQDGTGPQDITGGNTGATYTDWHIATIEWVKDRVTCYLDGRKVGETFERVPNTPMHWVLQTETNLFGVPVADTAQGNVQIDWVSVWRPAG